MLVVITTPGFPILFINNNHASLDRYSVYLFLEDWEILLDVVLIIRRKLLYTGPTSKGSKDIREFANNVFDTRIYFPLCYTSLISVCDVIS